MVEKWLQQVEKVMLASMRQVIENGIEAYVQVKRNWRTVLGHWDYKRSFGEIHWVSPFSWTFFLLLKLTSPSLWLLYLEILAL